MDIVVIRLIMRTKVMQKMQKTKAFGKEKAVCLCMKEESRRDDVKVNKVCLLLFWIEI